MSVPHQSVSLPRGGALDTSRFPVGWQPALQQALDYLHQSAVMREVFRRITDHDDGPLFIEYHRAHTKYLQHNPKNRRVQWNPQLGLHDVTGWLTPALLLGHELGHATLTDGERCAMLACERPCGYQHERYGVEEAWVIANVERPAALELNAARLLAGQPPLETADRVQHAMGRTMTVAGPLCACPVDPCPACPSRANACLAHTG